MGFLIRLVVNAIALLLIEYLVPGVHVSGFGAALIAALALGIVNDHSTGPAICMAANDVSE